MGYRCSSMRSNNNPMPPPEIVNYPPNEPVP